MTPHRKFEHCLCVLERYFDFIHQNVFRDRWKLSVGYVVNSFLISAAIYGVCYTIAYYDQYTVCNAAIILFGSIQTLLKCFFAWDLRHMADALQYIAIVYRVNSDMNARDHALCERFANYSQSIVKILPIYYLTMLTVYSCGSLPESATTGILKAPYFIYFPSIDGDVTVQADVPLFLCNIALMYICIIALCNYDSMILLSFCNVPPLSAIIVREVDDAQTILNGPYVARTEVKNRLLKIIAMQKKYKEIIEYFDQGFGRLCSVQIGTATAFTALSVFIAITGNFAGAYVAAAFGCIQNILYCSYGLLVEISSTRIEEAVARLDWHLLPREEKKLYVMFLSYTQKTQILYVAKVWPLNMGTSMTIFKSIYSYAMLLRSVVV